MTNSSVLEISHVLVPGVAQDLCRFLKSSFSTVMFIELPFKENEIRGNDTASRISIYTDGKLSKIQKGKLISGSQYIYWLRDLLCPLFFMLARLKVDMVIGLNCINACTGLILKVLGKTRKVIYYTIDLTDKRFNNSLFNFLYLGLDYIACKYCDEVWDVSESMSLLRSEKGYSKNIRINKIVPIGYYSSDYYSSGKFRRFKYSIIYLGSFYPYMGIQLIIEAMPLILKKLPNAKLKIVGSGEILADINQMIDKLKLHRHIKVVISQNRKRNIHELKRSRVGIALYRNDVGTYKRYSDPTKIKEYFAAGLPVVCTDVPAISKQIRDIPLGHVTTYATEDCACRIVQLLTDVAYYKKCTQNINKYIVQYEWQHIFSKALDL